jgi:hypothetical protein
MRRLAAAVLSALLCAACTSNLDVQSAVSTYKNQTACCSSLAQLPTEPLDKGDSRFEIYQNAPLFVFPEWGASYVKVFELPSSDTPYTIVVRSYLFTDGPPARWSAIFYPLLTLLDEAKAPLSTTRPEQARFLRSSFSDEPNDTHRLEVAVEISPASRAKYVVIHTAADMIGSARGFSVPTAGVTVPAGGAFVSTGGRTESLSLTASPITPPNYMKIRILQRP